MKTVSLELALNRWPYGLELHTSANGLLLRPRRKARDDWGRIFSRVRHTGDDLASVRQLSNEFDVKEWEW